MARNVEQRINTLENYFKVGFAVAFIFGISGAWGYSILSTAQAELKQLKNDIGATRTELNDLRIKTNLDAIHSRVSEEIKRIGDATNAGVTRLRVEAGAAARSAATDVVA